MVFPISTDSHFQNILIKLNLGVEFVHKAHHNNTHKENRIMKPA